jgi:hypothetical protein
MLTEIPSSPRNPGTTVSKKILASPLVPALICLTKGTARKINIDWLNGVSYVLLKTRVSLVFIILRLRILPYWVSGCLSYLLRKACGKLFLGGSMSVQKHYLRFFGNRVIRIFGSDSWRRRSFSLAWWRGSNPAMPMFRVFDSWSGRGRLADSTASDRNRGTHEGSAPQRVKT